MPEEGLTQPRVIRVAPDGDIFVTDSDAGQIIVFAADAAELPVTPEVFAEGLDRPFGIAFHPPENPQHIYIGESCQVVRFPYAEGDRTASGEAEVIIPDVPAERHWTRDVVSAPDGSRLFVSVGSASNVAGAMSDEPEGGIEAWEAEHGRGAAWDDETDRAVVRIFDPEGNEVTNFATGLRNCSGMTIQPGTDTLWCTGNEREHIGPNLAPDYLTISLDAAAFVADDHGQHRRLRPVLSARPAGGRVGDRYGDRGDAEQSRRLAQDGVRADHRVDARCSLCDRGRRRDAAKNALAMAAALAIALAPLSLLAARSPGFRIAPITAAIVFWAGPGCTSARWTLPPTDGRNRPGGQDMPAKMHTKTGKWSTYAGTDTGPKSGCRMARLCLGTVSNCLPPPRLIPARTPAPPR